MSSVSVVIPTYNRADLLGRALESVLAQTRQVDQIIVSDDCSTDNTQDVIAEWSKRDRRIVGVKTEKNSGPAGGRNRGAQAATCDLIAFLDSDDEWAPGHVEGCVGFLEAEPAIVLAFSDVRRVTTEGEVVHGRFLEESKGLLNYMKAHGSHADRWMFDSERDVLMRTFCVPIQTSVVRRDVIQSHPFDLNLRGPEDHAFALDLALAGKRFGFVRQIGGICYLHGGNLVADARAELRTCGELRKMWWKLIDDVRLTRRERAQARRHVARLSLVEGYTHRSAGRPKDAAKAYLRSLGHGISVPGIKGLLLSTVKPVAMRV